uniref:Fibronectin type-III domain-containing protein n=1 Tax=Sinocyclocheilus anshuiensis TaxID=1608454 RepID=A0A671MLF6_9TELE
MCEINGTVTFLIFCSAPDVPSIVMASSKESQSITVEFTSVSGATSYILRAETNDGSFFSEISVPGSPGTVTNLQPYTDYTLSVMSVNSAGRSQPSISVEAKTGIFFYSLSTLFDLEAKEMIHS